MWHSHNVLVTSENLHTYLHSLSQEIMETARHKDNNKAFELRKIAEDLDNLDDIYYEVDEKLSVVLDRLSVIEENE